MEQRERGERRLDGARRAEQMAYCALRGTHRHLALREPGSKHVKQRVTLRLITSARPGGVRVDVVHFVRFDAGVRQRRAHRARRAGARRRRLRDVKRVGGLAEASDFGVDFFRASRARVFQAFEYQHASALAHDEPGAGRVERATRRRVVVFVAVFAVFFCFSFRNCFRRTS